MRSKFAILLINFIIFTLNYQGNGGIMICIIVYLKDDCSRRKDRLEESAEKREKLLGNAAILTRGDGSGTKTGEKNEGMR